MRIGAEIRPHRALALNKEFGGEKISSLSHKNKVTDVGLNEEMRGHYMISALAVALESGGCVLLVWNEMHCRDSE